MTIVHVISGLGVGGAERNLVQMAQGLQKQSLPQHVVCLADRGALADEIEAHGISVTSFGIEKTIAAPAGIIRLARIIEELKAQIIQGWMYHGNLVAGFAHRWARGRAARRLLWNLRASNVEEPQHQRILRWTARVSHWPDVIIANSQAGASFHLQSGYRPRQLKVIPNGIDTERFRPDAQVRGAVRAQLGIAEDAVVAIHVARLNPMKDHATLCEVVARTPQIQWVLVGTGTNSLSLPANARALGVRGDIERLYAFADIVVSTSAFAEGFSNVLAEGMSAGLIPIATDVGDARLIVDATGVVLPPRNPHAIALSVAEEAERPHQERLARGLKARGRILEHFSLARAVDAYRHLYETLGSRRAAA